MRFHVVSLPHTQTTKAFNQCAYTQKVRKFCNMMKSLGHTVYLYASEDNEAQCDELITCITKQQQEYFLGDNEWFKNGQIYKVSYDEKLPFWQIFNQNVTEGIQKRIQKGDFVCLIAGKTQQSIINTFPYVSVEIGIGYTGTGAKFRVFESYAWMHYVWGKQAEYNNRQYEVVIPNYFEVADFPFSQVKKDYLLFMSRPIKQKGLDIAIELARRTGHKLITAGAEPVECEGVEWVGYADTKKRAELMRNAKALLCPTFYVGPFEGVVVEAQLCGTPVITTDWGCFAENVVEGKTGYRCHTMDEFLAAVKRIDKINPYACREFGLEYSTENVKLQYQKYFERLAALFVKLGV